MTAFKLKVLDELAKYLGVVRVDSLAELRLALQSGLLATPNFTFSSARYLKQNSVKTFPFKDVFYKEDLEFHEWDPFTNIEDAYHLQDFYLASATSDITKLLHCIEWRSKHYTVFASAEARTFAVYDVTTMNPISVSVP